MVSVAIFAGGINLVNQKKIIGAGILVILILAGIVTAANLGTQTPAKTDTATSAVEALSCSSTCTACATGSGECTCGSSCAASCGASCGCKNTLGSKCGCGN